MVLWIRDATGSAAVLGILLAVSSAPAVILAPFAGTFADRRSRRAIMVISDVVNGLGVFAVAALLFLWPERTELILAALFVQSTAAAVSGAFFIPAATAALPDLVPVARLARANAFIRITAQTVSFAGQFVAGFLYRYISVVVLFAFNGLTFLFSALSESFMSIPQTGVDRDIPDEGVPAALARAQGAPGSSGVLGRGQTRSEEAEGVRDFLRSTGEGFHYVWNRRGLRELVFGTALLGFFAIWIITLLPFYVPEVLGAGDEWYGILLAMFAGGALCGSLVAGFSRMSGEQRGRVVVTLFVLSAAGYILLGLVTSLPVVLALAFLGGGASGFNGVTVGTIVQASTPSEIRGRVFGIMGMISGSLAPVGMGLSGIVADLSGLRIGPIYVACGGAMLVVALIVASSPNFRRFVAYDVETEPPTSDSLSSVLDGAEA
jgi:MFS family permease